MLLLNLITKHHSQSKKLDILYILMSVMRYVIWSDEQSVTQANWQTQWRSYQSRKESELNSLVVKWQPFI